MNLLGRYLAATVIGASLIALLILVSLEAVFAFVDESGDIGRGGYGAMQALLYIVLRMPQRAYEAFPMATLIGSLLGLGGMAARNELTVMRAVGVSIFGIARPVLLAGFALAVAAFALGEWVAPPADRWAQELRSAAMTQNVASDRLTGFWARDGRSFVQAERAISNTQLGGVRIYRFEQDQQLTELISAAYAHYDGRAWILSDVVINRFVPEGVVLDRSAELVWESELAPTVLDVVVVDPRTLSITELRTYIDYLERNGLASERYRLAFWVKIATPLATVAMLLLTVPMVFSSARATNAGQRLFIGVLIGIVFFLANRLLNQMGLVYGLPPALSALLPATAFLLVGVWGILRVR